MRLPKAYLMTPVIAEITWSWTELLSLCKWHKGCRKGN